MGAPRALSLSHSQALIYSEVLERSPRSQVAGHWSCAAFFLLDVLSRCEMLVAHNGEMSSYSAGGAAVHGEEVGFESPSKEICSKYAIGTTVNEYAT